MSSSSRNGPNVNATIDERLRSTVISAIDDVTPDTDETDEHATDSDAGDAADDVDDPRDGDAASEPGDGPRRSRRFNLNRRSRRRRAVVYGILPAIVLALALGAGYMKWQYESARAAATARTESVGAATENTIALLSYRPDTVEQQLSAAKGRLTGTFRDSYGSLIHDVVIPGAQQKHISAVATVPAAASVSATANHAVVLVFVNQSIIVGTDAPTSSASSVRVTLDKVDGQWLISDFTPV
jgi:Mce-associated membrane protein